MKTLPLFLCLFALCGSAPLFAAANPVAPEAENGESELLPTTPYGLDRYAKLMNKSPFDFDAPPPPPAAAIDPMEGWALIGISKTAEYQSATLLNMKGNERIRLTKFNNPSIAKANTVKVGGDIYTLESIEFSEGSQVLKNATANITKAGNLVSVSYKAEAIQKNQAVAGRAPGMPGMPGNAPSPVLLNNGQGQPGGGGNNALAAMLQQRSTQSGAGGGMTVPGQGQGPQNNLNFNPQGQPVQGQVPVANNNNILPGATQAQPNAALQMNAQPQVFNNNTPAVQPPASIPGAPGQPIPTRRRVVLPNMDGGTPPVPGR